MANTMRGLEQYKQNVQAFIDKHGSYGRNVLDALNKVDVFSAYMGEDQNPDEYVTYAVKFIEHPASSFLDKFSATFKEYAHDIRVNNLEILKQALCKVYEVETNGGE